MFFKSVEIYNLFNEIIVSFKSDFNIIRIMLSKKLNFDSLFSFYICLSQNNVIFPILLFLAIPLILSSCTVWIRKSWSSSAG